MRSTSDSPLGHSRFCAALILVLGLSGCGLSADRSPTLEAADVTRKLESATGFVLRPVLPPTGVPGLPELTTTLTGSTAYESLTVFVFFEADGTKRVLGSGRRPAGTKVMTRSNVVILYRTSRGATDRSQQVRNALDAIIASA